MSTDFQLIGRGIYTLREAYRLTGIPRRRIIRWTQGYSFMHRGSMRYSPPVIAADEIRISDETVLSFLDLIEVRFLHSFREHGVSWRAIRIAAQRAKEILQRSHPFSTKIFKTDGRTILADFVAETGDNVLLDLVKNQYEFDKVISAYLYGGLEFNEFLEPFRWYPLRDKQTVVIDPARGFGAPIVEKGGIPTRILSQSYRGNPSYETVALWFGVEEEVVRDAVTFEQSLHN